MLFGCLAQLARASALHAEGQEFKSLNTHHKKTTAGWRFLFYLPLSFMPYATPISA